MGKKKKKLQKSKYFQIVITIVLVAVITLGILINWYFSLKAPVLLPPTLNDLALQHQIELGVHIDSKRLNQRIYPDIVTSQFGFITLDGGGSHFKEIHPAPGVNNFKGTDYMVSFAEQHNMSVQFHHLVWGDKVSLPDWLLNGNYTKAELLNILHDHINTVVSRYRGRVKEYVVVNEAITENQHVYNLKNWWSEHLGNDYIDKAFIWAHQADPNAKLLINDFNNETTNTTSNAIFDYVKSAKSRGVPIDGVGMQLHLKAQNPINKKLVIENMKRFAQIGAPVYVTEFDINTNKVKASGLSKQKIESNITRDTVRACIESKACVSFDVFGVSSKNDTIKAITRTNSRAYMFDSRYRPRQSFYAFRQAWIDN